MVVFFAILAMRFPAVRYLNTLLAIWLFISAFAFPHVSVAPVWNNAIVAIVIFVISLIPQGREAATTTATPGRQEAAGAADPASPAPANRLRRAQPNRTRYTGG